MNPILKKLQYKGQEKVFILGAPSSFETNLIELDAIIKRSVRKSDKIEYLIAFAENKKVLAKQISKVGPLLKEDAIIWFSYPKKNSKTYKSDINRDNGWEGMKEFDLLPVSIASIDQDWSSLRFRKRNYIKKLTRKPGTLGT